MLKKCAVLQLGIGTVRPERSFRDNPYWRRKGGCADAVERVFGHIDLPDPKSCARSGAWAGFIGGVAMVITLDLGYNSFGSSPFLPLQVLLYYVSGSAELAGSAVGVVLSLVMILAGSVGLGALFGYIVAKHVGKLGFVGAAGVGMTYGLLVWIVSQFVVLGFLVPNVVVLYDQNVLAMSHAIYGICLGLFGKAYHKN